MKSLLILGAGVYQVPLIRRVQERGLKAIVVSPSGYPGCEMADQFINCDLTQIKLALSLLERVSFDGVATAGADVALPLMGAICEGRKLQGPSPDACRLTSDKIGMKQKVAQFGIKSPAYLASNSYYEFQEFAQKLLVQGRKVVLKYPRSSGSRGVFFVTNVAQLHQAYRTLTQTYGEHESLIAEEFIDGIEFGAQGLVIGGKIRFLAPHGDELEHTSEHSVPVGHWIPYDSSVYEKTFALISKTCQALGIENSFLNLDCIYHEEEREVYLIEIGARVGGTALPELLSRAYGINYYDWIIDFALGETHFQSPVCEKNAFSGVLYSNHEVIFEKKHIEALNQSLLELGYKNGDFRLHFDYPVGARLKKFANGPDRFGAFELTNSSMSHLFRTVQQIRQLTKSMN